MITLKILIRELEAPALEVPTLLEKGLEVHFGMDMRKSTPCYPLSQHPCLQQAGPDEPAVAGGRSSIFPPESTFLGFPDSGIPLKLSPLGKGVWGEPVFCCGFCCCCCLLFERDPSFPILAANGGDLA